jgi:predicted TIM-barrel fold metal-dependent hydrolase
VIVDHQVHWLPPRSLDALTRRKRLPFAERSGDTWQVAITDGRMLEATAAITDLDGILELASSLDIDVVVASPPTLAEVMHLPGTEAGDLLRGVNEEFAAAQRTHPTRFVGLATLPMQDPDEALAVLDHAADIGLRGVMMHSSIEGRPIATDETLPVFQRLDDLRMPLILHPAVRSQTFAVNGGVTVAEGGIFWMAHTSAAAFNLIESGTLDLCPNLVVLHPHLGGVLPYLLGRLERIQNERQEIPIGEYLRTRFYTDTVGRTPGQVQLAMQTYGSRRVLFGSDNPFEQMAWMKQYVIDEGAADTVFPNVLPGLLP